jgi:hypothetical protein
MVLPKITTQYILKKAYDQVTAPPRQPAQPAPEPDARPAAPPQYQQQAAGPQRIVVENEHGVSLGIASRVDGIAIYVLGMDSHRAAANLPAILADPETEVLYQWEGARLAAIIYLPANHGPSGEAVRADDI